MQTAGIVSLACAGIIALMLAWWLIGGFILMVIWNALLPYLLGAPILSYPQGIALAVGLSIVGSAFKSVTTTK